MADEDRRLVYSTDGSLPLPTPAKRKPARPAKAGALPNDGIIRVAREKRRASAVTIVHGLAPNDIDAVGKELRRLCGTGGTTKNGVIELQGDQRELVISYLTERGHRVKRAGG